MSATYEQSPSLQETQFAGVLQMGVRVDETGSDQTVPMVLGDFPVDGHIVP